MPNLEELDGEVWGEPEFDSHLVGTCLLLRKKPLDEFTTEDLRIMIGQNIGLGFLVPKAIAVLEADPLAEGDCYPGDLLNNVIAVESSFYDQAPAFVGRIVAVARKAINRLRLSSDNSDLVSRIEEFVNKGST